MAATLWTNCWTTTATVLLQTMLRCAATTGSGLALPYSCPHAHAWCHDIIGSGDIKVRRDITYGSAPNRLSREQQRLLLDMYDPGDSAGPRPLALLIHGGGWHASGDVGGKNTKKVKMAAMAFAQRGFVAISIDYRCERAFGGKWLWVDAVADGRSALRWVGAHAEAYKIDMSRVVVYGTSAGAITVEGLCYMRAAANEPPVPKISAAISISGALFNDTSSICTPTEPPNSTCFPPGQHVWNPLYDHIPSSQSPPLIDFHGTADPTVPFDNATNRPLAKRNQSCSATDTTAFLDAAGAPNDLVPIPGAGHVPLAQVFAPPFNASFWGFLVAKLSPR